MAELSDLLLSVRWATYNGANVSARAVDVDQFSGSATFLNSYVRKRRGDISDVAHYLSLSLSFLLLLPSQSVSPQEMQTEKFSSWAPLETVCLFLFLSFSLSLSLSLSLSS
jgi:hypothetical protein